MTWYFSTDTTNWRTSTKRRRPCTCSLAAYGMPKSWNSTQMSNSSLSRAYDEKATDVLGKTQKKYTFEVPEDVTDGQTPVGERLPLAVGFLGIAIYPVKLCVVFAEGFAAVAAGSISEHNFVLKSHHMEFQLFGIPYAANEQVKGCADCQDVFAGTLWFETTKARLMLPIRS